MKRSLLAFLLFACASGAVLAQDECSTAIAVSDGINPSPPLGVSGMFFDNTGMTTSVGSPAPTCGSAPHNDIWFVYVASFSGLTTFSTDTPPGFTQGTHTDTILDVLDGSVCPPVTALGCDDDGGTTPSFSSTLNVTLSAGLVYYARVSTWSATPDGSFYLTVTPNIPPSNDECSGAISLTMGTNPTPPASGNLFTLTGATVSAGWAVPTCDTSVGADVWFVYVAATTGPHRFDSETPGGFAAGTMTGTVIDVFPDSSCIPGPLALGCDDDGGISPTANGSVVVTLTSGSVYYIRVSDDDTYTGGTFYVNVSLANPPANDECSGALPLSLGTNPTPAASGNTYTLTDASVSAGWAAPTCDVSIGADVWFYFVPGTTGLYQIDSETPAGFTAGTMIANVLDIFPDSACVPGPAALACDDDGGTSPTSNGLITIAMTAGTVYFIRVSDDDAYNGGTFYVNVTFLGVPAPNDECSGALALSLGVNPTPSASGNLFNNMNASTSLGWPALTPCPTAAAAINLDTWFSFTPAMSDVYQFTTVTPCGYSAGTMTNPSIGLYDGSVGSCGTPFGHMACDGDSATGSHAWLKASLVAGTTYYLRVGPTTSTGTAAVNATFYVTVTQGDVAGDTCASAIPLSMGTNPTPAADCFVFSNIGATDTAGYPAVCGTIVKDIWFSFTPAVTDSYIFDTNTPCGWTAGSSTNTTIAVYPPGCAPSASVGCDADTGAGTLSAVNVFLTGGLTYNVRVGVTATTGEGTFYLNVTQGVAAAPNDVCASATPVSTGINPQPAASCFTFDNTYATSDSMGYPAVCGTIVNDVWFVFIPPVTATYIIDTETPVGFTPGRMTNSTLAVYPDCLVGPPLVCDADSGVNPASNSRLEVAATAGVPLFIRVGSTSATTTEGSFYLTITPKFSLGFSSVACGGGLVDITANIVAGPLSGGYFMCVTLAPGAFPNGWFFGIDPFLSDVLAQAATPGFTGPLNAMGAASIGPVCGVPPGAITLYGVVLGFPTTTIDIPIANSEPVSFTP